MDTYKITRILTNRLGYPLIGRHVTFKFAQRGQQCIGYEPPRWISTQQDKRYLLEIGVDHLDHQHPYALE